MPGGDERHPDAVLINACLRFDILERRRKQLLATTDGDAPETNERLGRLTAAQARHLRVIHDARATTIVGHRARAASYLLWDAGDIALRAGHGSTTEDLLLHALLRDLVNRGSS